MLTRCGNTGSLKTDHITVDGDHLNIAINCHKGDQKGENSSTLKPVFGNPTNWKICPLDAIGIIILSMIFLGPQTDFFPQSCIEQLFNDWLKKTVESEQNEDDNVLSSNIKTHSTRKGPPSYAVSFPGLVNVIQVWLRAGWSLGTCYF